MTVEYSKSKEGNVNSEPTETTRLLDDDSDDMASRFRYRIKRTKEEFFSDYEPYDYLVFLSCLIILICVPLGLCSLAISLAAHNDSKAGNYHSAKKRVKLVYILLCLAILTDCAVVAIIIVLATA
ncbi:uncharacterized protein [Dysidea avara]|uniref:uncharacterized protein n=1 Tax=Dysidea avara TaxID=196820 RepID=UPI0033212DD1